MGFLKRLFGGMTGQTNSLNIALSILGKIGPVLWRVAQDGVDQAEAKGGTSAEKRAYALKQIGVSLKAMGKQELPHLVNLALELAVAALRK